MGWMGTVMSTVGWWAVIAGALAVLFNSLSYIKNLHDASTAPTAREFFGNVDEMKEDTMGALTGVMAIAGGKGAQKMGPNMGAMKPGKGIPKNIARQNFRANMKAKATALPKALASGAKKLFSAGKGGAKALQAKFKKWFGKDKDSIKTNKADKSTTKIDKDKVHEEMGPDGHTRKVQNDGQVATCSQCSLTRNKFKKELQANKKISKKLDELEAKLKDDPTNPDLLRQHRRIEFELETIKIDSSHMPKYLKDIKKGNKFNKLQESEYPFNEVYVKHGNKKVRVDSYDPVKGEIVSRKNTQFDSIQESTGLKYLDELETKYPPGAELADVASNKQKLNTPNNNFGVLNHGPKLKGQMILEVPVQNAPIPKAILDAAVNKDIIIRDINGKIY